MSSRAPSPDLPDIVSYRLSGAKRGLIGEKPPPEITPSPKTARTPQARSKAPVYWVHLNLESAAADKWLRTQTGLEAHICDALMADEIRPRSDFAEGGAIINFRGVNLNKDADPEDMVGIRLWVTKDRIISARRRTLQAIVAIRKDLEAGRGPETTGEFITTLADKLARRMEPVIEKIQDEVDDLEDTLVADEAAHRSDMRASLARLRRQAIMLRRYIAPQRDAIARLLAEKVDWLSDADRSRLREVSDRVIRFVEDLDNLRERCAIVHDELASRLSEELNSKMYVLSVIASIFLPLGFLTGLLGINVGGIPGAESPVGFVVFAIILALVAAAELWLFRKLKWI